MNRRNESERSSIVCREQVIGPLERRIEARGSPNELRKRVVELRERFIESCQRPIELSKCITEPSEWLIECSEYQVMRRFRDVNTPDPDASRFEHDMRSLVREGVCDIGDG